MKPPSPTQSLLLLLLAGLAMAGWFYGIHWKRVAAGDLFTNDERLMIRLQDQIQTLTQENAELHRRIGSLTKASDSEVEAPDETTPAPALPASPQKIETH